MTHKVDMQPTGKLRFVLRNTFDPSHGSWAHKVLQQEWACIGYDEKGRAGPTYEWRDVPTEEE